MIRMLDERNSSSSTQKTLDILLLFDNENIHLSVDDMSSCLDMPVSTVYRHVRVLCDNGFLERSHNKQYCLGMTFLKLSRAAFNSNRDLPLIALPSMKKIAESVGESVSLMRLFNKQVICIENIEGKHALRVTIAPGRVHHLHAGASAKAILAHLPENEWKELLKFPLKRFTSSTFVEFSALSAELHKIYSQGFSVSDGEIDVGARAIAIPLLNQHKHVIAALSIEGPASRMDDDKLAHYRDLLMQEASIIEQQLG